MRTGDETPALSGGKRGLQREEFVVVDVETTGFSAPAHRVVEIATVSVSDGRITRVSSSLVNPERRIARAVTTLTGISDRMVAGAPTFARLGAGVCDQLQDRIFIAHNVNFDWGFICAEIERAKLRPIRCRRLCTLRLARRLLPNAGSWSLGALIRYLGISTESRHRARADAEATANLLLHLLDLLAAQGIEDWGSLQRWLGNGRARRRQ